MYLLDSNVLIDAKNSYYPFDVVPAFWEWLDRAHDEGILASVEKVHEELMKKDDELTAWVKDRRGFFVDPDEETVEAMRATARWVMDEERLYTTAARAAFLNKADYYLVGAAVAHNHTVVTNEISQPSSKGRVKIPDVCIAMGADYATPFRMLRAEGVRFVSP
jgi:hypothetical protein